MNNPITDFKIIKSDSLTEKQRDDFVEKLYFVHSKIFSGIDLQTFRAYIFNQKATSQKIMLLYDKIKIIGYCAVHFFRITTDDKYYVIRAEAGILPEYRGNSPLVKFIFCEIFRHALKHTFRDVYYLGTLVHPSSYHNFHKFCDLVYPSFKQETPQVIFHIMQELVQYFGIKLKGPIEKMTCEVGWITRETAEEQLKWQQRKEDDIRYYLRLNPAYREGLGLITLIPCTLTNLLSILINLFKISVMK
ncbi:MAG: hypothetical protein AMJ61_14390 [Desulfobacterales bacterium SG8_35_2]|nr:MAG: hypothetical protein AMJ61_14390 [Desulfobacterales bacterium SG8_35_2]